MAGALLAAWQAIDEQIAVLSRRLVAVARQDEAVRRLMTAPSVGVLVALAYVNGGAKAGHCGGVIVGHIRRC